MESIVGDNKNEAEVRPPEQPQENRPRGKYLLTLALGTLGIVYGDIGTSPLYALRECFHGPHSIAPNPLNVLGVLSLIFWALVIVISIKYVMFVMLADNRGEGGILALMSLLSSDRSLKRRGLGLLIGFGLFGSALLYGDGMITPAISVLSAVEGLKVATPLFTDYVVPITILILIALFMVQKRGTAGIGAIFGPLTFFWFVTIALLGIWKIFSQPSVLLAINPWYGIQFFLINQWEGFLVLGSVFLVVTGGEALYADMGHFGKYPIRLSWFVVVFPALLLNYFGQGALLLQNPAASENPFFFMCPSWALYPMVVLATAATSIASQAIISGAFSLTRQAVQLGYFPRIQIRHTSSKEIGQIYIPFVNWMLMFTTIGLVLGFRSSQNLAAAYGVAVTTTMVITTALLFFVEVKLWKWSVSRAVLMTLFFISIDLAFFGANIIKFAHGGWFPLLVAAAIFTLMTTWWRGRKILSDRLQVSALPDDLFVSSCEINPPLRVPGTAVYMDRTPEATPHALLHNLKHNKVLHEKVILLTVETEDVPHVEENRRVVVVSKGHGIFRIVMRFGFMEDPNVPRVLEQVKVDGLEFKPSETSYFLGRESLIASPKWGMAIWREKVFIWMSKNAQNAATFFRIPSNRVVELGAQVEL